MTLQSEPEEPQISLQPVSYDAATGIGSALLVMAPGTRCDPHVHLGADEVYIAEGDLVDADGQRHEAGALVRRHPSARHPSLSPSGCKLVVFRHGPAPGEHP